MRHLICIALALLLAGCKKTQPAASDVLGASPTPAVLTNLPLQVRTFIERKEQLALTLAKKLGVDPDRPTFEYFALARKGEFAEASRLCRDLAERGGIVSSARLDTNVTLSLWDPLFEVELTLEAYAKGAGKFAKEYGEAIVQCIPPGSIYFGGTDCGRGLVAAFTSPDADGDPFFILSQNAFANGRHLAYLRAIFGE